MKKKVLGRFILMGVLALVALVYLLPNLLYDRWPESGLVDSLRATANQQGIETQIERNKLIISFDPMPEELKEVISNSYPMLKFASPGKYEIVHWWTQLMPTRGITLGLDLQGGLHLVYEVEEDKAVEITTERIAQAIRDVSAENGIESTIKVEGPLITVSPTTQELAKLIEDEFPTLASETEGVYKLSDDEVKLIKSSAPDQVLESFRNRIDRYGVAEPSIQRQGTYEIVVQLPGVKDPSSAIDIMGKTAQLEFKLAHDEAPLAAELPVSIAPDQDEEILEQFKDRIPEGDEILFIINKDSVDRKKVVSKSPILLKKDALITGALLSDARVTIDQTYNEPAVSFTFNSAGAKLFEKITSANVGKRMAIILDGTVYSAPNERIPGGRGQITGRFSDRQARDLALVLKEGALPAPVKRLQNVTVGPSLGRDSIDAGKTAGLIGAVLVVVFMIIYYRVAGVIADFALVLNILLLLGAMAMLEATLTLPGIAGIILAIGMAVDSNVLMFERMREEIRTGKTPRAAVDSGYDKAFWTIFDSHVTTLITALVLFQFGTGPIKGFAVTLSFGVAINLFTALVGTKTVFDFINSRTEVKRLSI